MGAVQGHDGRAMAVFELQAAVARVVEQGDLGWKVHGLDYQAAAVAGSVMGRYVKKQLTAGCCINHWARPATRPMNPALEESVHGGHLAAVFPECSSRTRH